jgi:glycosyltransferase involved in cell wall biosynthesis
MKGTRKHGAVICSTPPFPVNSGTRLRAVCAIRALEELGHDVTVIYPCIRKLDTDVAGGLGVAKSLRLSRGIRQSLRESLVYRGLLKPRTETTSCHRFPVATLDKFKLRNLPRFEVAITEYSCATPFSAHIRAKHHILDSCDILSIHLEKVRELEAQHSAFTAGKDRDFVRLQNDPPPTAAGVSANELEDFRKYDSIIAIAEQEHDLFDRLGLNHICLIPPCVKLPAEGTQDYAGFPIFPFSNNIFNLQGLFHFVRNLLPLIVREEPDFRLVVTGSPPPELSGCPHLIFPGYVADMDNLYRQFGFGVVPVFRGTGQQLKVSELLSYGIPVVSYRMRIDPGVLVDGQGGFLANTEKEFIARTLELWRDRKLASQMGRDALSRAESKLSQAVFTQNLKEIIDTLA